MLKAARLFTVRDVRVVEADTPEPGPDQALVRVMAASICGTDLHYYRGDAIPARLPITLGHEYSGVVEQVGEGVNNFKPGDRVYGSPVSPCGGCEYCRVGAYQLCISRVGIGVHVDGYIAEYLLVPRADLTLQKIPDGVGFEEAALYGDLATTALHTVERAGVKPGWSVAVLGMGPIGILSALISQRLGSNVVGVKMGSKKVEQAMSMGIQTVISMKSPKPVDKLIEISKGGFNAVLDTASTPASITLALKIVRRGGVVVVTALHPEKIPLNLTRLTMNEITLKGALCPAGPENLKHVAETIKRLEIDLSKFVTHRYTIEESPQAFKNYDEKVGGILKPIISQIVYLTRSSSNI